MPIIDTTGIRPIERRQPTEGLERVRRRDEGGSGFRPQTNVNLKAAIQDIAATLGKIVAEEKTGIQRLPKEIGDVVKNILQQALSVESTLGKGIGSTIESQRFSMEQLLLFSRMLSQMGTLAERGYSMRLSEDTQTLMTQFKSLLVAQEGGEALEPVLVTKAAFELVDAKTAEQLPQALYEILSQLAQISTGIQQQPQPSSEGMQFLKQLIKFFMPRPGVDVTEKDLKQQAQNQSGQRGQSTSSSFLNSMFRTFGGRTQAQPQPQSQPTNQFSQPQAQGQPTNQFSQLQTQGQPTNQFTQPQTQPQGQPTNQFSQPQPQGQPTNQFAQPQAQGQPTNQFSQPQAQGQPTNQFAQPQAQSQPTNQFAQPQAQSQPTNQFSQPQPQAQSQPTNQFTQPQAQSQPTNQFAQPQAQSQPTNQFAQPQPQAQGQPTNQFTQPQAQGQPTNQFAQPQAQSQPTNQFTQPQAQSQPTNQFAQPQAQGQPTNQFAQPQAQSQPTNQFTQPQAQGHPTNQFTQPQPQAQSQPTNQFAQPQPQAQGQPTNQFAQPQAQSQPTNQFSQPQPQGQPTNQFAQPQAQSQPTNQFAQPQAQGQPTNQFAQPQAQGQPTNQFSQSQAQGQPTNQFTQPQAQGQPTNQFAQSQAQGQPTNQFTQPQAQSTTTQFNQPQLPLNQPPDQPVTKDFVTRQKEMRHQMKIAKESMIKQNMLNTPQTNDATKGLAQFPLRGSQITPRDAALLQNFVNNSQQTMSETEARHLQNLLRLCQQNVPLTVQQAAVQQKLPDLPRLWAFMQMCDMANIAAKTNPRSYKRASKDIADFANAMRRAMTSENSIVQDKRSFQMMMPLYIGEDKTTYPTYLSIYDELERDEETGEDKKETWLRICVLTDYIGAAELVFRVYDETKLDMRFYFSRQDVAEEFRSIYLDDLRNSINQTQLNIGEVRVGGGSERMFSF